MQFISKTPIWITAAILLVGGAVACGGKSAGPESDVSSPVPLPSVTASNAGPRATPTSPATSSARTTQVPVRQSPPAQGTATAEPTQLDLIILAPIDGAQLHAGAVRVIGMAPQDAVVAVNGEPAEIQPDGTFTSDLVLDDDVVGIEVSATDLTGAATTAQLAVFNESDIGGLPLDVLYPRDGMQTSSPSIEVVGVTSLDAVVAVDGKTVTMNSLGIFTQPVELTEGANLIEVTATNTGGEVKSSSVAVFYVP